jgi:hypothetical protein
VDEEVWMNKCSRPCLLSLSLPIIYALSLSWQVDEEARKAAAIAADIAVAEAVGGRKVLFSLSRARARALALLTHANMIWMFVSRECIV